MGRVRRAARSARALLTDRALRLLGLDLRAEYVQRPPTPQNALDLFRGEWASRLPEPFAGYSAGEADLFRDDRIAWLVARVGGVSGWRVLECGPLEGGHTYMLEGRGAGSVVAIEANTRAYLRCLITKELFGLDRSRFLLGDFVEYMRGGEEFDLVVACGVLYHLTDPVEAIALAARTAPRLYIWTHYFDAERIAARRALAFRFDGSSAAEHAGFRHTLHRQRYQTRRGNPAFFGGAEAHSHWLTREDLLGALRFFGYDRITLQFDRPDDPAGPNISLLAERSAPGTEAPDRAPPGDGGGDGG